jgi:diaminohydroxyphosphoribosylaminopyrimidine deaminase / 5-amino-6-(5-phosphoribosylamino)uracil reductase
MYRCLQLAQLGSGHTAPNPMVGAVLVYNDRIIGEGHTQPYGQAHAEVMCINSVAEADKHLISSAVLYVSLEPCAHHGKTPPCSDLIIRSGITQVVVGCADPFEAVNGKGIAQLQAAGIKVVTGILEKECQALNQRFFTYHIQQRPYIILKWAQSANGQVGTHGKRTAISGPITNRLVHRWRSEEMAIMVGGRTAITDNPQLTTRLWQGKSPIRIVVAGETLLPDHLHLFDGAVPTIVFASGQAAQYPHASYYPLPTGEAAIPELLGQLYQLQINSVLVEGGARLLQSFINSGLWDEARIITNTKLVIEHGLPAPILSQHLFTNQQILGSDSIAYYRNNSSLGAERHRAKGTASFITHNS